MKKFLIILGTVFLLIIILAVIGIGLAVVKGSALDKQSKAYVDSTVPTIVSTWDEQELLSRASPELTQSIKQDDLDKLYVMFRKLGRLREYQGSEGHSLMSFTSGDGKRTTATYTAKANFEAGPAVVKIGLIRHGDQWQINGFHIDSNVFLDH